MIKAILMIDCNACGQLFNRVLTSESKDPLTWKALSTDLENMAVNCAWTAHRSAHFCEYCMTHLDFELLLEKEQAELSQATKLQSGSTPGGRLGC